MSDVKFNLKPVSKKPSRRFRPTSGTDKLRDDLQTIEDEYRIGYDITPKLLVFFENMIKEMDATVKITEEKIKDAEMTSQYKDRTFSKIHTLRRMVLLSFQGSEPLWV